MNNVSKENITLDVVEVILNFLARPEHTPRIIRSSRGLENGLAPTLIFLIEKSSSIESLVCIIIGV